MKKLEGEESAKYSFPLKREKSGCSSLSQANE
jgi:hypothetical protein